MFVQFKTLFLKPAESVKSALKSPNIGVAIFIILISGVLGILSAIQIGAKLDVAGIALSLVKGVIGWGLASLILYLVIMLVRGKMTASFQAVASAFSMVFVYFSIFTIIMMVATAFLIPAAYVDLMKLGYTENLTSSELNELSLILQAGDMEKLQAFNAQRLITTENKAAMESIILENKPLFNPQLMATLTFLNLFIMYLFGLILIPFAIIREAGKFGFIGSVILLVLGLAVMGFVGNVYQTLPF